jgi:hypothetical protein
MKRLTTRLFGVLLLLVLARPVAAQQQHTEYPGLETGKMWTFDVPPLDYWAKRYNFHPSSEWLTHVYKAAARLPGCTASFVSADGLVMSNHHCARSCIDGVTRPGEDFLQNGFYAPTRADERPCPGTYLDQLLSIRDVTDSVNLAVPAGATPAVEGQRRSAAISDLQDRCSKSGPGLQCQVVTMYRGGQYKLYTFRRYTDLRLVFAPEDSIAFWGGDPDNFTYPRHDMDVSFMRAYDNGQPLHTDYYQWSQKGAAEGDLVFVIGNPGSTGRLYTIAQLEYFRDVQYPPTNEGYARQIAILHELSAASETRMKAFRNQLFGLENELKRSKVYQSSLSDPSLMQRKRAWEQDFRARVNANPELKRQFGDAWDKIAVIRKDLAVSAVKRRYYSFNWYNSQLLNIAGLVVRYPAEMAKPDSARMPIFRDQNKARLERVLYGAPVDTVVDRRLLAAFLATMEQTLPASDPLRRQALGTGTPDQAATAMVSASVLTSPEGIRKLVEGGATAIAASNDPFIVLARLIDPVERQVSTEATALIDRENQENTRIARALLAVFGNSVAPDATFSLRITDGEVLRFPYNGTLAQPFTTFYGLYDRWTGFNGQAPWNLPQRWIDARDKVNLGTQLNAVSTNDIIGGNSGSPVISRDGEVVGLIFDGNMESLPGRWLYMEEANRAVWVDARGILEALRSVYGATAIVNELTAGR